MNSEIKEKKKVNLKISKTFILIGLIVIILGVVFLSSSIVDFNQSKEQYNIEKEQKETAYNTSLAEYESECDRIDAEYAQAMANYEQAYNEFQEQFMQGNASISDAPNMPTKEKYPDRPIRNFDALLSFPKVPAMLPISIIIIVGGLAILVVGLKPYITKFVLKHKKETLDYAGEDMTNIGNAMVDIGAPVINNAMDSVIVPTVSKVKEAVSDTSKKLTIKLIVNIVEN